MSVDSVVGGHLGLAALALFIAVGSLVPVLPTGALVSATTAAAATSDTPVLSLVGVFAAASAGAFVGDVTLYAVGRSAGGPALHRLSRRADPARLVEAQHRLSDHSIGVLTISRLLPAGRIPVLVASVVVDLPWRRFLAGNVVAVLAWSAVYMVIGTLGAAIFPSTWQAVLAAVVIVSVVAWAPAAWRHLRPHLPHHLHVGHRDAAGPAPSAGRDHADSRPRG